MFPNTLLILSILSCAISFPVETITHSTTLSSGHTIHNLAFRGPGLYIASFNNLGVASVEFTPITSLSVSNAGAPSRDVVDSDGVPANVDDVGLVTESEKRSALIEHANCYNQQPSSNVTELDMANEIAAGGVEGYQGGEFRKEQWVWVRSFTFLPHLTPTLTHCTNPHLPSSLYPLPSLVSLTKPTLTGLPPHLNLLHLQHPSQPSHLLYDHFSARQGE